ncbi:hypothetical protein GCM10027089_44830 [Nocardia thraciensis]
MVPITKPPPSPPPPVRPDPHPATASSARPAIPTAATLFTLAPGTRLLRAADAGEAENRMTVLISQRGRARGLDHRPGAYAVNFGMAGTVPPGRCKYVAFRNN